MAEDDEDEDDEDVEDEDGDGEDGDDEDGESSGGGKSKLILFIAIGVVFLLIAGGATAYFLGAFDSMFGGSDDAAMEESAGGASGAGSGGGGGGGGSKPVNVRTVGHKYELPELALQLKPEGRQPHAALVRITLMLGRAEEEDIVHMDQSAAKITESLQQAVAEFSFADFQGSSGPYLLREVLLQRVPPLAKPVIIRDILITSMIVQ
jgi:flagellar basal body-associated protein FliL